MGGEFEGKQTTIGAQMGANPSLATPGKSTQVGAQGEADAAVPASRNDPDVVPPEYAKMDPDCRRLLAEAYRKDTFPAFADKKVPYWDLVDQQLSARQLQAFTQTIAGARRAGILPQISGLSDIYNHGSSWGIHFTAPASAPTGWGKDYDPRHPKDPQGAVRKEHGKTDRHVWYRQPSGPGNPGMHLGTQEEGEKESNLHWDPSNPMDHVSEGTEGKNNPLIAGMPNPFKDHAPILDALVPKGCAVYNPMALATHANDIGWIDKNAPWLKQYIPASKAPSANSSTEPFFTLSASAELARWGIKFAKWEMDRQGEMGNKSRGIATSAHLIAAGQKVIAHEVSARPLALQERTPDTEPGRVALASVLATLLDDFYNATTGFFFHLHAEIDETPSNWSKDDIIKMGDGYWSMQGEVFRVHETRQKKRAANR